MAQPEVQGVPLTTFFRRKSVQGSAPPAAALQVRVANSAGGSVGWGATAAASEI